MNNNNNIKSFVNKRQPNAINSERNLMNYQLSNRNNNNNKNFLNIQK